MQNQTLEQIIESIREILADGAKERIVEWAPDTHFKELGIDSLRLVRLLAQVEDKYGIEIADEDAYRAYSMTRLANLIHVKTSVGNTMNL